MLYTDPSQIWWTLTFAGLGGQLAGHGVAWALQIKDGKAIQDLFTTKELMWAAFNLATEVGTAASVYSTNSVWAPLNVPASLLPNTTQMIVLRGRLSSAAVDANSAVSALSLRNPLPAVTSIPRVLSAVNGAIMKDPQLLGTFGSALAKSSFAMGPIPPFLLPPLTLLKPKLAAVSVAIGSVGAVAGTISPALANGLTLGLQTMLLGLSLA